MSEIEKSAQTDRILNVGFIGFGEAGSLIACGLAEAGKAKISAFDPRFGSSDQAGSPAARAQAAGVHIADNVEQLVATSDIVLSTVVARVAEDVATSAAEHLGPRHVFADLNSVSPETKQAIGATVGASGAGFVEAAIITNVAKKRHRVPVFAYGPASRVFTETMNAVGMDIEDLGPRLGRASATKMFRSIMVKGLEALFLECLLAAEAYDVGDRVLEKVQEGYPGMDWKALANNLVGRTAEHGERRADEMEEVAATLRQMGIEPFMAAAAAKRIAFCGRGLKEQFAGRDSFTYRDVIAAVRART